MPQRWSWGCAIRRCIRSPPRTITPSSLEDAEIDALIVESGKFAARGAAIRSRVPGLKHLLSFGPVEGARDLLAELPNVAAAPLIDDSATSDIAWLAYTGGTTGRSKGVMIPHRALTTMTVLLYADWDWPAEIRYLAATPISHAAGVTVYPVMLRGGFVRLVQGFETESYCRVIEEEKITAVFLVPTLIYALIDAPQIRAKFDLSSLDMIVYGAAPVVTGPLARGDRDLWSGVRAALWPDRSAAMHHHDAQERS
ncbi:MAG: AMP-binding protein [Rhodopseudomonas palustris]|nr:AMP-binding protein [Rhodopseudomonas palustris]